MLIETKSITELALVFGSTWVVIGVVITAILIMAYLANAVVQRWTLPQGVVYALLVLSLAAGMALISADLSAWPLGLERAVLTVALTLPLFFSGLAFSAQIRRTASVGSALASNILGAMLGGFLEYNSMVFGFRSLYVLAIVMYLAAFVGAVRSRSAQPGGA